MQLDPDYKATKKCPTKISLRHFGKTKQIMFKVHFHLYSRFIQILCLTTVAILLDMGKFGRRLPDD